MPLSTGLAAPLCRACAPAGLVLGLVGCSDYRFDKVAAVEPVPTVAAVAVSPAAHAGGGVCGAETVPVTISSVGDGLLTISGLSVEGTGWALSAGPSLPTTLSPGDSLGVELTGAGGPAALVVESDDPERPTVRVALESTADLPPTIVLELPGDGGVFDIDATDPLVARVSDEAPAGLLVTWSTDGEGPIATATVEADGTATAHWVARDRLAGAQVLTATVTDACGQTASDQLGVCQAEGFVADALDLSTWHLEGTAAWDASREVVELTSLDPFAVGTAFQTARAVSGTALSIRFEVETGGGTGADGLSLTLLDIDRMDGFMGAPGCALGYGEAHPSCVDEGAALPGWSLELDTYYNPSIDPSSSNHLSLTVDGALDLDQLLAWADLPDIEDTGWHSVVVDVQVPEFSVAIDGLPLLSATIDPALLPDFDAYVGFTAATGADTNRHGIRGLVVEGDLCEDWRPL